MGREVICFPWHYETLLRSAPNVIAGINYTNDIHSHSSFLPVAVAILRSSSTLVLK